MEERRQFVRLDTRLDVDYSIVPAQTKWHATTKNIGGGGICLFLDQVVPSGTRLQVTMRLPDSQQTLRFGAEVVWCESYEILGKGGQHQQSVEAGIRFVEIAPKDQDAIMQHVILQVKPPAA